VHLEYAGLARGEDPAIAVAVADLVRDHGAAMDAAGTVGAAGAGTAPVDAASGADEGAELRG